MTDQQDLRARLLEECDRKENIPTRVPTMNPRTRLVHSDRVRDLLREAAAQLGRVGEPEVPSPSNWLTGILAKVPTMVLTDSMIRGIEFEAYRAMENDQHRAAAKERLISQQKAPEVNSTPQPDSQKSCGGECHHDWRGDGLCDKCGATYATDSAAPGGDVERLREALENLISVAEPMVAEDGKCPPIREPNERGGTTVTIDPFPLLKYRVEDMDDLREGIKSARAIIAALSAPKQVGGLPDAVLLDRGFQIKDGVVTPTLLFGFNPDDWAARDRFAAMINTSPQAAPVPVEGEGRIGAILAMPDEIGLYQGPDDCPHLKINGVSLAIFPAGSWGEVCDALDEITGSRTAPPSQPAVELEEFRPAVELYVQILRQKLSEKRAFRLDVAAAQRDFEGAERLLALIDGAKAGKGE